MTINYGEIILGLYPIYPVLLPIISAIIIALICRLTRNKALLGTISSLLFLGALYIALENLWETLHTKDPIVVYYANFAPPLGSCFEIDALSAFIATIFALVGFAVAVYSIGYMEEEGIGNYYVLLSLLVAGLIGVAYAGDFFTLFVFYELLGVTAYILVAFYKNREAIEAAVKYLIMGAAGSALILYGMALIYGLTGTLNMALIAKTMKNAQLGPQLYLILLLFLIGFGVKAAIVPMHSWLPDAHPAAPSGISAMLSGVVIKAGMYALFRTVFILFYGKDSPTGYIWNWHISLLFAIIAIITITLPNIIALVQTDIKRMLAYSSIYNMGIIFAGIAIGTKFAIAAALFHLLNHALAKALLFMNSGAFIMRGKTRVIEDLKGIGKKMPGTGVSFLTGCLSLAGLPPLAGFYSKFFVIWAAILAIFDGNIIGYILAITLAINATVSLGYYFAVLVRKIWLVSEPSEKLGDINEAPITVLFSEILIATLIIAVSFLPLIVMDTISEIVNIFVNIDAYISAVVG